MVIEELEKLNIEQIRVFESFEKTDGCAFCRLIENFEDQVMNAISQDLVMDLEFFPKFGLEYTFCDYHMNKMEKTRDKLGMAIMLKKLITMEIKRMESGNVDGGKSLFSFKKIEDKKCFICEKIDLKAMRGDVSIAVDLWLNKEVFRELYNSQNYFCIKHFKLLLEIGKERLNKKDYELFKKETLEIEKRYCKELEDDLEWFINKYDYRYREEPWKNSKDSIYRARAILRRSKE